MKYFTKKDWALLEIAVQCRMDAAWENRAVSKWDAKQLDQWEKLLVKVKTIKELVNGCKK